MSKMSSLLDTAQKLAEVHLVQPSKALFESTFLRQAQPATSRTAAVLDPLFGPRVPYFVSIFRQTCRLIALAIVLPILLMAFLDLTGYAVIRILGFHRQRVRVNRAAKSGEAPPRFVKRKPRHYDSDRGRPTDNSNMPSIEKAPLLSPGTYDAETLLRHRARSLSAASEDFDKAYISSGGYFARVGVKRSDKDDDDDLLSPPISNLSETEDSNPQSVRVPGIGVDGALGFADTDVESGTESGRNSPVRTFRSLDGRKGSGGGSPAASSQRRRGLSGGLKFTKVSDEQGRERYRSQQPSRSISSASTSTAEVDETGASADVGVGEAGSLGGSWIGVDDGDVAPLSAAAAAAADLETETSNF